MSMDVSSSWGQGAFPVKLHHHFSVVPFSGLAESAKDLWRAAGEQALPESLLIPNCPQRSSVIPLRGDIRVAIEQLEKGCTWNEAVSTLSLNSINRLFASGVLSASCDGLTISGPAVPLLVESATNGHPPKLLRTDPLSSRCLSHAARLPLHETLSLSRRMYHFNHHGVYACTEMQETVGLCTRLVSSSRTGEFEEISATPPSAYWTYFSRKSRNSSLPLDQPKAYKLYVSPRVDDLVPCLERLIHILPKTSAMSWKIGKGLFGLSRPDKICIYFQSHVEADQGAEMLLPLLDGIRTQGVPFTRRYDDHGLVSGGIDPPDLTLGAAAEEGTSWREWICRKLSAALLLARRHPNYPLAFEQSALWSAHYMGVNAETWGVTDLGFWRN